MKEETPAQRSRVLVFGWLALGILVLVGLVVMLGMIYGSKPQPTKIDKIETSP